MIFEPPPEAGPAAAAASTTGEVAEIDGDWPDEPPSAAPVQLATVPPAAPAPAPASTRSAVVPGRRGRARWAAAAIFALAACGVGLRVYRSRTPPVAASSPPMLMPATASATVTPPAQVSASASPAPPVAAPQPESRAEPASPSPLPPFDAAAAKQALDATASAVARCRRGNVSGPAHAIVTFGNDGAVRRCAVSPPYLGKLAGMCVAKALSQARVPAFAGSASGVVVHPFAVPAQ